MIVEERIYRMKPGKAPEYIRGYEQEGLAIQRPILGNLVGYYSTEIGPLNVIVHLWAYEDMADRAKRRAQLTTDARWLAYLPKVSHLLEQQENRILNPAPFFEPILRAMLAAAPR
ncbi:MAG: NIPSNAP domain containing protein [Betaproteobacteria bacterium RBG_16_64_18]|nr:MAG: NIPSNAP domain containing protein [Betaproteobacteria bacterium RBG_16_64_18]OGA08501.1 MAG: NIPSNAP domain containing protein [Betaproteobacteria bacterium RIFCSPLOWO2_02_FULL_65_20]